MAKIHGNKLENARDHHVYGIYDHEQRTMFKFGISDNQVIENHSFRTTSQVNLFNSVAGAHRFSAKILLRGLPGRRSARTQEDAFIRQYHKKHGELPRGNTNHQFLK